MALTGAGSRRTASGTGSDTVTITARYTSTHTTIRKLINDLTGAEMVPHQLGTVRARAIEIVTDALRAAAKEVR
jgi:hypothetical protein